MSRRHDVWLDFAVQTIIAAVRDPGFVMLSPRQDLYRYLPGRRRLEPVPHRLHEGVHETIYLGLVGLGDTVRLPAEALSDRDNAASGHGLVVTRQGSRLVPEATTVTYQGRRYRIERSQDSNGPNTTMEHWPGRGYIGTNRRFLGGSRFAKTVTWFATVNPTGDELGGREGTEGLASRRAALDWLFAHTPTAGSDQSAR